MSSEHDLTTVVDNLVGIFPNIQVLLTDLRDAGGIDEVVRRVRGVCAEAHQNSDLPFHRLLEVPAFARTPIPSSWTPSTRRPAVRGSTWGR